VLDQVRASHYGRRAAVEGLAEGRAVEDAASRGKSARGWDLLWFCAWALVSTTWCVTAAIQLGPTFDEPVHLDLGLRYWRDGNHRDLVAGGGTMPLPVDVFTFPVYVWERWRGAPFDLKTDLESVLPVARVAMLVFWWLLLVYGWRMGQALAGRWGARLAVALLASEPVLLGHASLATADVALSACLLALAYHHRSGREGRWGRRLVLPGFWFGMAFLAKASGLVCGGLCLVIIECEYLLRSGGWRNRLFLLRSFCDLSLVVAGGLLLAGFWCGDDRDPRRPLALAELPQGPADRGLTWLAERARSMTNAYHAVQFQVHHNRVGHGNVFLLGETRPGSFGYYFPVVLTVKVTLAVLALPVVLLLLRPRALVNWACLAAFVILAATPFCKIQLGIRLVLPLVVLAIVGLAAALARTWQAEASRPRRRLLAAVGAGGVLWSAWAALSVWPQGLCYTNELWGGTRKGYRVLSDSNYDWGQGLPELARWQQQHGLASMDVWYYGTDPALFHLPLRELSWNALAAHGPERLRDCLRGRIFAASTTMLYGSNSSEPAARFLRSCRPVARTSTFLIYDFAR